MRWYRNLRMTTKILLPVGLMLFVTLGLLAWQIQSKSSVIIEDIAQRELAAVAGKYGNEAKATFEVALDAAQTLSDAFAPSLEQNDGLTRELIIRQLQGVGNASEAIISTGMAFEPNVLGNDADYADKPGHDKAGRFMPYLEQDKEPAPLGDVEKEEYYAEPKKRNHTYLTKPYFYEANGKKILLSTASAAVKTGGSFKGAVFCDLSLERITKDVGALKIYTSGWGTILTQDGTVVADKDASLVGKSQFELGRVSRPDDLKAAMRDGKSFTGRSTIKDRDTLLYYFPIHFDLTGQTWYFVASAPLDEVLAAVSEISILTLGISAGVLLLSILLIFVVVRVSVKPLSVLSGVAQEIAGGNLKVAINDEGFGGEVKDLSTALKDMIASLLENIGKAEAMSADAKEQTAKAQEAMREAEAARLAAEKAKREGMLTAAGQLEDVVSIISAASEELSAQVEQSERGSTEQAARVGETATAMEEMNSTVLEVARSASAASDMSAKTRAKAEEGSHVVQAAVDGIRNVQTVSLALKEDMGKLSEQAQSISNIMGVISDIADQTNLLALNAAIEAARAGDAGRGFAVVADEVRKLAEKTMTSTSDVGSAIGAIQQSTAKSMASMDSAVAQVEQATAYSGKSGQALNDIVGTVEDAVGRISAIAAASEEQSVASEQINRSIDEVNSVMASTARSMAEARQETDRLVALIERLGDLTAHLQD